MNLSIEKTEHFTQISTSENALHEKLAEALVNKAKEALSKEEITYFIFDISEVTTLDVNCISLLQDFGSAMQENLGLVIFKNENPTIHQVMSEHDFVIVPSQSEAVEYIYMDQLEKQFLTDSE
ncbi:MAG: STAS domain-containing protein [Bacteroidota bacterium]|jgi:anti-anti-sigma regulatory factor|nr:STAS domain-containing protein [Bacteroidota bacterium]